MLDDPHKHMIGTEMLSTGRFSLAFQLQPVRDTLKKWMIPTLIWFRRVKLDVKSRYSVVSTEPSQNKSC
jgi:hypothetical protein